LRSLPRIDGLEACCLSIVHNSGHRPWTTVPVFMADATVVKHRNYPEPSSSQNRMKSGLFGAKNKLEIQMVYSAALLRCSAIF
jgi:hypothetical protein